MSLGRNQVVRIALGCAVVWIAGLSIIQPVLARKAGEATDPRGDVLWFRESEAKALFIPQSVLDHSPLERLPLSEMQQSDFERRLDIQRRPELYADRYPGGRVPSCQEHPEPGSQGSSPNARDFASLMALEDFVFVGEISTVESGIYPRSIEAGEVAYVEVEKVVSCRPSAPGVSVGSTYAIRFRGGKAVVDGTVLCDQKPSGFYEPKAGDRILVAGLLSDTDPRVVVAENVFPLRGSRIVSQPYAFLKKGADPGSIQDLGIRIEELRGEGGGSR